METTINLKKSITKLVSDLQEALNCSKKTGMLHQATENIVGSISEFLYCLNTCPDCDIDKSKIELVVLYIDKFLTLFLETACSEKQINANLRSKAVENIYKIYSSIQTVNQNNQLIILSSLEKFLEIIQSKYVNTELKIKAIEYISKICCSIKTVNEDNCAIIFSSLKMFSEIVQSEQMNMQLKTKAIECTNKICCSVKTANAVSCKIILSGLKTFSEIVQSKRVNIELKIKVVEYIGEICSSIQIIDQDNQLIILSGLKKLSEITQLEPMNIQLRKGAIDNMCRIYLSVASHNQKLIESCLKGLLRIVTSVPLIDTELMDSIAKCIGKICLNVVSKDQQSNFVIKKLPEIMDQVLEHNKIKIPFHNMIIYNIKRLLFCTVDTVNTRLVNRFDFPKQGTKEKTQFERLKGAYNETPVLLGKALALYRPSK